MVSINCEIYDDTLSDDREIVEEKLAQKIKKNCCLGLIDRILEILGRILPKSKY